MLATASSQKVELCIERAAVLTASCKMTFNPLFRAICLFLQSIQPWMLFSPGYFPAPPMAGGAGRLEWPFLAMPAHRAQERLRSPSLGNAAPATAISRKDLIYDVHCFLLRKRLLVA